MSDETSTMRSIVRAEIIILIPESPPQKRYLRIAKPCVLFGVLNFSTVCTSCVHLTEQCMMIEI